MRKSKKTIACVLSITVAISLLLTACGQAKPTNTKQKQAVSETIPAEGTAADVPKRIIGMISSIPEGRTPYLDYDTENGSFVVKGAEAKPVTSSDTEWGTDGEDSWYVANSNITISKKRIICHGNVHLILADGFKLSVEGGIEVIKGNSFTVYGQEKGSGMLVCEKPGENTPAIGGYRCDLVPNPAVPGDITINGGYIVAQGGTSASGIGGAYNYRLDLKLDCTITINGGKIIAKAGRGSAAAIGGGPRSSSGTIVINGGDITAIGTSDSSGSGGPGIGGGNQGSVDSITINGGKILACGGGQSAGIGGERCSIGSIVINGGEITALGGEIGGAGIGAGAYSSFNEKSVIEINGGKVTAYGFCKSAGIGGALNVSGTAKVIINGGEIEAYGERGIGMNCTITLSPGDGQAINVKLLFEENPEGTTYTEATTFSSSSREVHLKTIK